LTFGTKVGVPKTKSALSAFASLLAGRITPVAMTKQMRTRFVLLSVFMIHTSVLVLFLGLLYNDKSLGAGVQTIRPRLAGPVSCLVGDVTLTGCFFVDRTWCESVCSLS
jgi:hypothetical protein